MKLFYNHSGIATPRRRIFWREITTGILAAAIALNLSCQEKGGEGHPGSGDRPRPQISSEISGDTIRFSITVPENHHAYLDKGSEGNLIPVTFDWGGMKEPGPVFVPIGTRDERVRATVLRGSGDFLFRSPNAMEYSGKKVRVLTQICDDIQGICYRPEYSDIFLKVTN
jgi:hypothetical protein